MKLIRNNIFETNSSSTHCVILTSKDNYEKFKNKEMYLDIEHEALVSQEYKDKIEKEVIFINTKLDFNWNDKTVTYKDQTVPYDNYREILLTSENLASVTEEDIKQYYEDNGFSEEIPVDIDDFDNYMNECNYYPYDKVNDDINAVAFGYYGNDY